MAEVVAVLGASPKTERYSYQATAMLSDYGHRALPVNPYHAEVAGKPCVRSLSDITEPVDTVTLYLNPGQLAEHEAALIALAPKRVIFNPGTESPQLQARLAAAGIKAEEACTLVLLRTGQF